MANHELILVQTCATRSEAEFAKGLLESARIDATIQSDTAGGMREHLAWSGSGFRVLVREEDADSAREILRVPEKRKHS